MPGVLESYDLTAIQSGMLVHALRSPGRGVDIRQIVARQPKAYQRDAFAAAWSAVMARHAALRTAFAWVDHEKPHQLVYAPDGVTLPITDDDWSALAPGEQDERLVDYLRTDRARDFDLACPPLMRVHLVRLSPTASLFVLKFHHALLDGRAFHLVLEDLYAFLDRDDPEAAETNWAASPNPEFRDYVD